MTRPGTAKRSIADVDDRVLSMAFPSGFQLKKLAGFLDSTHKGHYRVYSLCAEHTYDHKKFAEGACVGRRVDSY